MKYKVLLVGNNRGIINEFFTYMDYNFECISTSEHYDDVKNHLKYVKPDVVAYCLYQERLDDMKRFINTASKLFRRNTPLVVIGNSTDCNEFLRMGAYLRPLVLKKPITIKDIATAITNMLKEREELEEEMFQKEAAEAVLDAEKTVPNTEEISSGEKSERKKHILIVDDDSSVLRLLKGYLEERYELATAINGRVALKFLETKETDLILLDYEMSTENGAAVLKKIRANEKTKDLPVVFLTGVTDKSRVREVLDMKPHGYLLKPIDMNKLSSTIKGILD